MCLSLIYIYLLLTVHLLCQFSQEALGPHSQPPPVFLSSLWSRESGRCARGREIPSLAPGVSTLRCLTNLSSFNIVLKVSEVLFILFRNLFSVLQPGVVLLICLPGELLLSLSFPIRS